MAVECPSSAIRVSPRIKLEHYPRDFAPVSPFRIRVEQAQICDEVLLIVDRQYRIGGGGRRHWDQAAASALVPRFTIETSKLGSRHIDDVNGEGRFTLKSRRPRSGPVRSAKGNCGHLRSGLASLFTGVRGRQAEPNELTLQLHYTNPPVRLAKRTEMFDDAIRRGQARVVVN